MRSHLSVLSWRVAWSDSQWYEDLFCCYMGKSAVFYPLMLYLLKQVAPRARMERQWPSEKLDGNMSLKLSTGRRHYCFLFSRRPRSRGKVSLPRAPGRRAADSGVLCALPAVLRNPSGLLLIWAGQLPQLWFSVILNCYFLLTNKTDGQHESRGWVQH